MAGLETDTIDVTTDHWPVVVFRHGEGMTTADLRGALDWWDAHVATRDEPYAIVVDSRGSERLAATHRKIIIDRMQRNKEHQRYCEAAAFVFRSAFLRSMLNAILWVANPGYPVRAFSELEPAIRWASAQARTVAA